jgi:hypothetical protein
MIELHDKNIHGQYDEIDLQYKIKHQQQQQQHKQ